MDVNETPETKAQKNEWIELEFVALRTEILALAEAERATVRFFIPAAAVVYTVPYFILPHFVAVSHQQTAFLWTFCAVVAGLLCLAMIQSLFWSVDGARRIGAYIREGIEPQTGGGLRWERVCFAFHQIPTSSFSEALTISASAVAANLAAAAGGALLFLDGNDRLWPPVAASVFALLSLRCLRRIAQSGASRRTYAEQVRRYLADSSRNG